jgi:AcrR family transcriptional regulator
MAKDTLTKGEQTRLQILAAAHRLFLEQGYNGTSMRQIAAEAGIALGGIYNHFPNKEDIFKQVLFHHHPYQDVLPAVLEAQGQTPEALVRDMAARMVEALQGRRGFLELMFIEIVEFQSAHLPELFANIFPQALKIIQRLLSEYPQHIRPIPPAVILRTFIGLFFSYYITEIILKSSPNWPEVFQKDAIDQFVDVYLHGILQDGASAKREEA